MYKYYLSQLVKVKKALFLTIAGTILTTVTITTNNPFWVYTLATVGGISMSLAGLYDLLKYKISKFISFSTTLISTLIYVVCLGNRKNTWDNYNQTLTEQISGGIASIIPIISFLVEKLLKLPAHHKELLIYSGIFNLYKMAPKENNECRIFLSEEFKDFLINDFRDKLTLDLLSNFFTVMSSKNMTNKIKEEIIDWWRSLKQNKDKYNNINHKNLAKMVLVDYLKSKNASNLMDPEIKSYKPNETLTFPSSSPNVSPILTGYENSNNTANNKFHIDKNSTQSQNKERSLQRRRISI